MRKSVIVIFDDGEIGWGRRVQADSHDESHED